MLIIKPNQTVFYFLESEVAIKYEDITNPLGKQTNKQQKPLGVPGQEADHHATLKLHQLSLVSQGHTPAPQLGEQGTDDILV